MNKITAKKILFSVASIGAAGMIAFGATQAFFSDSETSFGNLLQAGALDLQIDNTCYYNGNACEEGHWASGELQGKECSCTWTKKNLDRGDLFWNLNDIKPGDREEDTISFDVDNSSWVCADVKLTSNRENIRLQPEINDGDLTNDPNGGELASHVNFIYWADDGDNVLETCQGSEDPKCVEEKPIPGGNMGVLGVGQTATVALADSHSSIWGPGPSPSPLPGGVTKYVGKAWCFGKITAAPLPQDGKGADSPRTPANSTGGITCDGALENNVTQTDSFTADIRFRAIQSRNNSGFVCTQTPISSPIHE